MNILAIIPARGGSKGIPQKNIRHVAGKPLITWNILATRESKHVTRTVVSTDDAAIKEVSLRYGAEVIDRPADLSGDTASSESALLHTLEYLRGTEGYVPDLVVFLQCTSPLTASADIDSCIDMLLEADADSATTVTDFHYFVWKPLADGTAHGVNHDKRFRPRRQDREPQYLETGAVYVMRTGGFLEAKHRFFGRTVVSVMPAERVQEIDEPVDLVAAEVRLREILKKSTRTMLPQAIEAVVFDFDGVMTNNKVVVSETGQESVVCDRGDGMGITMLKRTGIPIAVMSTETNPVVSARCQKLGVECYQSLGHAKHEALAEWCAAKNIDCRNVVYMGNDINDIECMKMVGCTVAPADAHPSVLPYSSIVLNKNGGEGAVRELCDLIMESLPR